jgi:predicted nuclease with TOPRIM domain
MFKQKTCYLTCAEIRVHKINLGYSSVITSTEFEELIAIKDQFKELKDDHELLKKKLTAITDHLSQRTTTFDELEKELNKKPNPSYAPVPSCPPEPMSDQQR